VSITRTAERDLKR